MPLCGTINSLSALLEGMTNRQIARRLNISESMVKGHLRALMQKYQTDSRIGIVLQHFWQVQPPAGISPRLGCA